MTEAGSADARARWNAKHAAALGEPVAPGGPAAFLTDRADLLPTRGRALDVAGGIGSNALWLAERGLATTLVDVSDTACAAATRRAVEAGVALDVERRDVAATGVPPGPWDVIVVHRWLDRDRWRQLPAELGPGGVLLISHPTATNLERHERPGRRWLLEDAELARSVAAWCHDHPQLEVVEQGEGWTSAGSHDAWVVLRSSLER